MSYLLFLGITIHTALNVIIVGMCQTCQHIFSMFYTQRYYPRLYVRNVITNVGLDTIQPNFISVRKRGNQEHVIFHIKVCGA